MAIGNSTGNALHEWAVGDLVEVISQISVDHFMLAGRDVEVHSSDCHLGVEPVSKSVLLLWQIGLVYRTRDQDNRHLDDPISNGRYAQRTLSAVALRNPHSPEGLRRVGPRL